MDPTKLKLLRSVDSVMAARVHKEFELVNTTNIKITAYEENQHKKIHDLEESYKKLMQGVLDKEEKKTTDLKNKHREQLKSLQATQNQEIIRRKEEQAKVMRMRKDAHEPQKDKSINAVKIEGAKAIAELRREQEEAQQKLKSIWENEDELEKKRLRTLRDIEAARAEEERTKTLKNVEVAKRKATPIFGPEVPKGPRGYSTPRNSSPRSQSPYHDHSGFRSSRRHNRSDSRDSRDRYRDHYDSWDSRDRSHGRHNFRDSWGRSHGHYNSRHSPDYHRESNPRSFGDSWKTSNNSASRRHSQYNTDSISKATRNFQDRAESPTGRVSVSHRSSRDGPEYGGNHDYQFSQEQAHFQGDSISSRTRVNKDSEFSTGSKDNGFSMSNEDAERKVSIKKEEALHFDTNKGQDPQGWFPVTEFSPAKAEVKFTAFPVSTVESPQKDTSLFMPRIKSDISPPRTRLDNSSIKVELATPDKLTKSRQNTLLIGDSEKALPPPLLITPNRSATISRASPSKPFGLVVRNPIQGMGRRFPNSSEKVKSEETNGIEKSPFDDLPLTPRQPIIRERLASSEKRRMSAIELSIAQRQAPATLTKRQKVDRDLQQSKQGANLQNSQTFKKKNTDAIVYRPASTEEQLRALSRRDTTTEFQLRSVTYKRDDNKGIFRWGLESGRSRTFLKLEDRIYMPCINGHIMSNSYSEWFVDQKLIQKVQYYSPKSMVQITREKVDGAGTEIWFVFNQADGLQKFLASLPNSVILQRLDRIVDGWGYN